jgi:hypothetical protein
MCKKWAKNHVNPKNDAYKTPMLIYNNFEQKTSVPNMRGLEEVQRETNLPYLEKTL